MELNWNRVLPHLPRMLAGAGDPLCAYLYDLDALHRHAGALVASLPKGCELFYAIKANPDLPVLETLAPLVHGFEVSSGGELAWVREHFPRIPVVFSGPGKTDRELDLALEHAAEAIHVESLGELHRLSTISLARKQEAPVLLRVNLPLESTTHTSLMMGGRPSPFGMAADQVPGCLAWLRQHPNLRLRGFHFHLLSHQLDAVAHLQMLRASLQQIGRWLEEFGIEPEHVNVGGGIGINYREPARQFDWPVFAAGLGQLQQETGLRLRLECGRFVSAACGYYATQVIDIKQSFGRDYVVVRGGTHHFRTPYAQGHSHPFRVMTVEHWAYDIERPSLESRVVHVVGQLCTPKDLLAFDAPVERVRVGDVLVFPFAGAYAWHISHHDFLRHPHPVHHYLPVESRARAANE